MFERWRVLVFVFGGVVVVRGVRGGVAGVGGDWGVAEWTLGDMGRAVGCRWVLG